MNTIIKISVLFSVLLLETACFRIVPRSSSDPLASNHEAGKDYYAAQANSDNDTMASLYHGSPYPAYYYPWYQYPFYYDPVLAGFYPNYFPYYYSYWGYPYWYDPYYFYYDDLDYYVYTDRDGNIFREALDEFLENRRDAWAERSAHLQDFFDNRRDQRQKRIEHYRERRHIRRETFRARTEPFGSPGPLRDGTCLPGGGLLGGMRGRR